MEHDLQFQYCLIRNQQLSQGVQRCSKRVILITGTPCVGKTSIARLLSSTLQAVLYVNLTDLALKEKLTSRQRQTAQLHIVDEERMKKKTAKNSLEVSVKENVVVDGHYAAQRRSRKPWSACFRVATRPVELRELMEQSAFQKSQAAMRIGFEILDVCLVEALNVVGQRKVCEVDTTGKSVEERGSGNHCFCSITPAIAKWHSRLAWSA